MKSIVKIFRILCLSIFVLSACSKDDDPVNNDLFIGRYTGKVSYTSDSENKSNDDGYVQVVKVGDKYNFIFSDGIKEITGIQIEKNENTAVMIGSTDTHYIKINANKLTILYLKDGAIWGADTTR